ncbi:hypothetical protein KP509_11G071900 [Ceratopteris richardii]|nr:hypothetical protein KP509_11G071900 [Ceratopteris richardii]
MDVEILSCHESVDHIEDEGDAYDESDDDEFSLQPLAFVVDGEPDFTSGSPQDGFEYLRRVMWEAAQCPKVKVAKIGKKQLIAEQTRYMPVIAPIPTCFSHLLPSKEWVHAFLEDFSALRLSISKIPIHNNCTEDLPSVRNESVWQHLCFGQGMNTFCDGSSDEQNDIMADDACAQKLCSPCGNVNSPCLKFLLRLDENSRATLLRYHVEWLKEQSQLGHHRAMWLFALAAAVDYPLDDQTCAAFRDLLRKCAEFRAVKSEVDEELYMINILITIAGEFFGQAEQFSTLNA